MGNYEFKNKGTKLFDLLAFSLGFRPQDRVNVEKALGKYDLVSGWRAQYGTELADFVYANIAHWDGGMEMRDLLGKVLSGPQRLSSWDYEKVRDATEDMRKMLEILTHPDDLHGQKVLFDIIKTWPSIRGNEGYEERYANVCRSFLFNPDLTFRIKDQDMIKYLLFEMGKNKGPFWNKFKVYEEIFHLKDVNFNADDLQRLYDNLLDGRHDFEDHYKGSKYELQAKQFTESVLKEVKEKLDSMRAKEVTKEQEPVKTDVVKEQNSVPADNSEQVEQPTRKKTYEELESENESLRKQVKLLRESLAAMQQDQNQQQQPVMMNQRPNSMS